MGIARKDTKKVKNQCRICGRLRLHDMRCDLGHNVYCYRQSRKKCADYQSPSVFQAAKELAEAAGIDM